MYLKKLTKMKKTKIFYIVLSLFLITLFSCEQDLEPQNQDLSTSTKKVGKELLYVSYTISSTIDYNMPPYDLTEFEMSYLNPSSEKNKVVMKLFNDGSTYLEINKIHDAKEIKLPNHILPDDRPEIVKTIISGNTITTYDTKGKVRTNQSIDIPNQMEMVNKIKALGKKFTAEEISQTIATMQGHQFIDNLNDFIANATSNNIQILEQGSNYVTLRMPLNMVDPNLDQECVLLIDKSKNRLVGNRIYSSDDKLLQTTYFGYNTGDVQSLNAIKTVEKITLPSGFEIDQVSLDKIDNLKFNLNI